MPHIPRLMNLYSTRTYERAIRKLLAEDARAEMEATIVAAPDAAPVIRGTGGIRTIYFWHTGPGAIYMLTAYAKADRDDLSPADRKALKRVVADIEQERGEE